MAVNHSVEFAGGNLGGHRHICALFNSIDEEHRVLRSFFKDGFDRGDKAFHLVDPELREEHLRRLAEAGINVHEAMDTGQLEVLRHILAGISCGAVGLLIAVVVKMLMPLLKRRDVAGLILMVAVFVAIGLMSPCSTCGCPIRTAWLFLRKLISTSFRPVL